jgi:uncharacterized protein (DUF2062 family)
MPRRFFRKFALKRDWLERQWYLAPFSHLLHDPRLWGITRRSAVPAVALGLFISYLPLPGHMLVAALLALALRVNIPIAAIATLVTNPLTVGPMYFFAFQLGEWLLGVEPRPFAFELSMAWMMDGFVYIWQPLLLGCVLLGALLSISGYVALDLLWRASVSTYLEKRRRRSSRPDNRR